MKIAIIGSRGLTNSYGGIEKVLLEICPRIAALGHEVHVFGGELDPTVELTEGVRHICTPAIKGKYTETISRSFLGVARAILGNYDVINLVAVGPGVLSPVLRLTRKPVVVSIHGLDWARDKWPRPAQAALRAAERTIVAYADEISTVSEQIVNYFSKTYDRDVVHTPNGVEVRQGDADQSVLAELGLIEGEYILFASRLVEEKGAHELIEAALLHGRV